MLGPRRCRGAVVIGEVYDDDTAAALHAQALCDQLGLALERARRCAERRRRASRRRRRQVRNALLAAIAHDHRTPLATILGAASSLQEQASGLAPRSASAWRATIVDEADAPGAADRQHAAAGAPGRAGRAAALRLGVGRGARRRGAARARASAIRSARVRARVEPGLPLLRCDAVLLVAAARQPGRQRAQVQPPTTRRSSCWRAASTSDVVLAVRDRGPGVAPALARAHLRRLPARRRRAGRRAERGRRAGAGVGPGRVPRHRARARRRAAAAAARARRLRSFECLLPLRDRAAGSPNDEPAP